MQIYANLFKINEKCYFSVISWPILILFVLSDRAWCGLQNFYTEFWNSLIMQIYANLFKINEKCYFSVISWPILILFVLSDRAWCWLQNLILFVLSDRAWCGLQNFYTEFWNSLIMQIYANSFKINETCHLSSNIQKSQQICTWGGDVYYASRNLRSTCLCLEIKINWNLKLEIKWNKVHSRTHHHDHRAVHAPELAEALYSVSHRPGAILCGWNL